MSTQSHKGQILPLANQLIPISQNTTFHASYDNNLIGFNQGQEVSPYGHAKSLRSQTNTIVRVPHSSSYPTTGLTVEFWMRPNQLIVAELVTKYNAANTNLTGFELYQNNDKITFWLTTGPNITSAIALAVGTWVHVACTWDGSTLRTYINGVQDATTAAIASMPVATGDLVFGRYISGSYPYDGNMNDVRIWNYARTGQQIKDSMNIKLRGDEVGLYGNWKLSEGTGTIANDHSMNCNSGMITNGTWEGGRLIATPRPDGKFGGAVAVEEATTNLMKGKDGIVIATDGSVVNKIDEYTYQVTTANAAISGIKFNSVITNDTFNKTFSGYIQGTKGVQLAIQLHSSFIYPVLTGGKDYFCITAPSDSNGSVAIFTGYGSSPNQVTTFTLYNQQTEIKSFATSFVNGSRSSGLLTYPSSIVNPSEGTIAFWLKRVFPIGDGTIRGIASLGGFWDGDTAGLGHTETWCHQIFYHGPGFTWYFRLGKGNGTTYSAYDITFGDGTIPVDTWTHVAMTWKANDYMRVYLNGQQNSLATTVLASQFKYPTVWIGGSYSGTMTPQPAQSLIDDIRIDRVAVTADEIMAWYQSNAPFYNYLDYTGVGY